MCLRVGSHDQRLRMVVVHQCLFVRRRRRILCRRWGVLFQLSLLVGQGP